MNIPQQYGKNSSILSPSTKSRGTAVERRKLLEIEQLNKKAKLNNETGEVAKGNLEILCILEQETQSYIDVFHRITSLEIPARQILEESQQGLLPRQVVHSSFEPVPVQLSV